MSFKNNKLEWKLKNEIMNKVVAHGGVIFGGAVRDKYLHDMHAIEFYDSEDVMNYVSYEVKTYRPELFGRWVVPNDIDIYIHESQLENLIEELEKCFGMQKCFSRDPSEYISDMVVPNTMEHRKYRLYPIAVSRVEIQVRNALRKGMSNTMFAHLHTELKELFDKVQTAAMSCGQIMLDVLVSKVPLHEKQPVPPFGKVDFLCNGLILDAYGFQVSTAVQPDKRDAIHRMKLKDYICAQVLRKEAVMDCTTCPQFRLNKMAKKGWKIVYNFVSIKVAEDDASDVGEKERCIICHEEFVNAHYKLRCCAAMYHSQCIINAAEKGVASMIQTKRCIMCKSAMGVWFEEDIGILKSIVQVENAV